MATPVGVLLSAAAKIARGRRAIWVDGPIVSPRELKVWQVELDAYLRWVAEVERSALTTAHAAQRIRRMSYSAPLGAAGRFFDRVIRTDPTRLRRPMTTTDVRQAVLDGLVRVGSVQMPSPAPFDLVELSHVFVLQDLRLNGRGPAGDQYALIALRHASVESILSWAGDLGSAWVAYNDRRVPAMRAAGSSWTEPTTPAALATPLGWLNTGIAGRAPIDDLLGDMDAVALFAAPIGTGIEPLADLLASYYRPAAPAPALHVSNRFSLFVTNANPAIPHTVTAGGVALSATARDEIREVIVAAARRLLLAARTGGAITGPSTATKAASVELDLRSPWGEAMFDELADRVTQFLTNGLAGLAVSWPSQPPPVVGYPGYELPLSATSTLNDIEAVSQFFLNWTQPHRDLPLTPRLFTPLDLRDPAGVDASLLGPGATAGTTRIRLGDDFRDLVRLRADAAAPAEHRDLLWLANDTARASVTYRIVEFDPATREVTVEGTPVLSGTASRWSVIQRPWLVLVDPIGGRLGGNSATKPSLPTVIELDGSPDLSRVNVNLDTIFLAEEDVRPSKVFRIISVDPVLPRVTVDGSGPALGRTPTAWLICAGVADTVNPPVYTFTPTATGCDHYDGLLFVVYSNSLRGTPLPWTSFASILAVGQERSSIRGNARYLLSSYRSENDYRNFSYKVTDRGQTDLVSEARFYLDGVVSNRQPRTSPADPPAPIDADGKTQIRLHYGDQGGAGTGSGGGLVSPRYFELRTALIALHQSERAAIGLAADADLTTISGAATLAQSRQLYNDTGGQTGTTPRWADRLVAELILIRPDERPS